MVGWLSLGTLPFAALTLATFLVEKFVRSDERKIAVLCLCMTGLGVPAVCTCYSAWAHLGEPLSPDDWFAHPPPLIAP